MKVSRHVVISTRKATWTIAALISISTVAVVVVVVFVVVVVVVRPVEIAIATTALSAFFSVTRSVT